MKTLLTLLALPLAVAAQTAQPGTMIKTETRVVQVDAVVTDKSGNPVDDLTVKDFHLWEDNKEQTIQNVSLENHSGNGASPAYTVLFFNNASLDSATETRVREAAAKFVAANAGPKNLMAVADFGSALELTQNFTADAQRLEQVVAKAKLAAALNDGMGPAKSARAGETNAFGSSNASSIAGREGQLHFLQALAWLARNLHEVPGRKSVVMFSAGMPVDSAVVPAVNSTINLCNRVNVSVYPLITEGLLAEQTAGVIDQNTASRRNASQGGSGLYDITPNRSDSVTDQMLHTLAKGTGGYVAQNTNDLAGMMGKILKEESGYYLLSYTPAESPDGSCHALRVKADRGSELRARATYCNTKPVDLLAGKPAEQVLESRLAGNQAGNLAASMELSFFYSEPGVALLNVAMEIPTSAWKFQNMKGRFHGEASVLGVAYTADGMAAARFSDAVSLDFSNQVEVDNFKAHPYHYEKQLHIAPGKYTFKAVFAAGADSFSKVEEPLAIDAYDGKEFAVSGLALSKELDPAAQVGTAADEELMEGRVPLVFHDMRFVPSGGNTFQKSDALAIYLEIYDPAALTPQPPSLGIQLRVLDRKTGEEKLNGASKVEAADVAGKRAVPYGLRFKLDALPPAAYTAEVKVVDAAGKSATRKIDFEVRAAANVW